MNLLLDHNVPRRLWRHLLPHATTTAREQGWDQLQNGELLKAAADAAFDAFISIDKKIEYEHNLMKLPLPVLILDVQSNALEYLLPLMQPVLALLNKPITPALYIISPDGTFQRLTAPR